MRLSRSSGRVSLFFATSVSLALGAFASTASAAPPAAAPRSTTTGPARSSTQFTLRREEAGGADGQIARQRARSGDCAAALPLFDAAIRTTIEPTLRRDRGMCHDKLGQPYPAIDDYRAYLTARPEANDAEQIRLRLATLEDAVAKGGSDGAEGTNSDWGKDPSAAEAKAASDVTIGSGGTDGSVAGSGSKKDKDKDKKRDRSNVLGPKQGERERSFDAYAREEKALDEAEQSPLREGTGPIVGAFGYVPRFFFAENVSDNMAFGAGATLRYSTGPNLTIVSELGFAGIGTQGDLTAFSGPLLMAGVEGRIPLTPYASDHIVLRGGAGFERYTVAGSKIGLNMIAGRFAAGYRHVFGPVLGVEFLLDGGPAFMDPDNVDGGENKGKLVGFLGGSFAVLVGF